MRTHPDLPELHGGPQQHPVHLRGGLHPAAAPPSLRGVPGILVTSLNLSSPCYSPHLQSMRWDSTVYFILQETNDEYYLVNIQVLHQTLYTTYIYYESKSVTD